MAAVAILVSGTPTEDQASLASGLGEILGCPTLSVDGVVAGLTTMVGPVVPAARVREIATGTVLATADAVEAGVVLVGAWTPADRLVLEAGLGSARVVELHTEAESEPIGVGPVVRVDPAGDFDLAALVQEIAAHFGA
jgi:hypothetical protein